MNIIPGNICMSKASAIIARTRCQTLAINHDAAVDLAQPAPDVRFLTCHAGGSSLQEVDETLDSNSWIEIRELFLNACWLAPRFFVSAPVDFDLYVDRRDVFTAIKYCSFVYQRRLELDAARWLYRASLRGDKLRDDSPLVQLFCLVCSAEMAGLELRLYLYLPIC
eukprot:TRINITY_DN12221_c1_g6_i1.p1 TRINITY_DN12221_c1_g6~~TRINITY_DN12221_c1_g6_i1.p1  ORF type:complete len:166 (+),score=23.67 TRINITY_DN12221_c1_g6_i1:1380-1877(+)